MEFSSALTSFLALVFVLSLIAIFSAVLKRYGQGSGFAKKDGKEARLCIKEVKMLDGKRKLMLIGRDDQEHLLLLSGDKEIVVERNITPVVKSNCLEEENKPTDGEDKIQMKGDE